METDICLENYFCRGWTQCVVMHRLRELLILQCLCLGRRGRRQCFVLTAPSPDLRMSTAP